MNNNLNTDAVRQLLNRSASELDQPVLDRLRQAREQALLRHDPGKRHAHWADTLRYGIRHHAVATVFATLVLTITVAGGLDYYWSDTSDVDIAILTDEMPVYVYID
jgi:hypothetical protein